jgi:DNA-binding response OmpR family regulator
LTKKILIAHSNLKAKRTLTLLLADAGFDIRAVAKAAEAVELAKHELFDLALVENALRVPESDMLSAIRSEQPTLPVS